MKGEKKPALWRSQAIWNQVSCYKWQRPSFLVEAYKRIYWKDTEGAPRISARTAGTKANQETSGIETGDLIALCAYMLLWSLSVSLSLSHTHTHTHTHTHLCLFLPSSKLCCCRRAFFIWQRTWLLASLDLQNPSSETPEERENIFVLLSVFKHP